MNKKIGSVSSFSYNQLGLVLINKLAVIVSLIISILVGSIMIVAVVYTINVVYSEICIQIDSTKALVT